MADTENHRVQKFIESGDHLLSFGSLCVLRTGLQCVDPDGSGPLELGDGEFERPGGIAVDGEGNVYVADTFNHRIQVFRPDGTFVGKWGQRGGGNGEFQFPRGIAVDSTGKVYVTDTDLGRVHVFQVQLP